ncbi:ATP-binding protein [Nocardioides sp.]|uniref:sensor histidine kinase n=1 Tax=Nocardioides sp. TaxID=35761 RepID=UPI002637E63B|nr:ATP-binding protein [Nocardioides sp.]
MSTSAVFLGLAAFVGSVYVVVVVGGGTLIGHTGSPSVLLSVLATTVVALAFQRVQTELERLTARWSPGGVRPYDVLSHFADEVTGADSSHGLPERMAMLLAQGTGAEWTQVWLNVSGRATLAASWPPDVDVDRTPPSFGHENAVVTPTGSRTLPVRQGRQLLGVLRLQERPGLALTRIEERLFAGLAAQAGLVLKRVALRAELDDRREELLVRSAEISASRERLIETQDTERSRLERDLHDGAQQHLVALTVNLRLAHTIVERSPRRAAVILTEQADAALMAIETLSTLSRGIYPRQLADEGLGSALRAGIVGSAMSVRIEGHELGRLPAAVEAALYFSCMEAVQNATKHSNATSVSVRLDENQNRWRLTVTDNGIGFNPRDATVATGAGLANMRDRMDAIGGAVEVSSSYGGGTTVTTVVPRSDASDTVAPGSRPISVAV